MSKWTRIRGMITIDAVGRTQSEKRYILETILSHLPLVTGSEKDMYTHIVQAAGYNHYTSFDEFGCITNNLTDSYGDHDRKNGEMRNQDFYYIVVEGNFRDRDFNTTFIEFNKWLCRLAKRTFVTDVLVKLSYYSKDYLFTNQNDCYTDMYEYPSWSVNNNTGEPAWWEYLYSKEIGCVEWAKL